MGEVKTNAPGTEENNAPPADPAQGDQGKAKAGDKNKGKNKKKKDNLECGENGTYGDLKKKTGGGQFDRDHVPSKGALKRFAKDECNGGEDLCKRQKKAIEQIGAAIAIPKAVHKDYSPTYGGRNTDTQIGNDAGNLQGAAQRDTAKVSQGMKDPCKKKYDEWAKKVNNTTNDDYKKMLSAAISPFKPK